MVYSFGFSLEMETTKEVWEWDETKHPDDCAGCGCLLIEGCWVYKCPRCDRVVLCVDCSEMGYICEGCRVCRGCDKEEDDGDDRFKLCETCQTACNTEYNVYCQKCSRTCVHGVCDSTACSEHARQCLDCLGYRCRYHMDECHGCHDAVCVGCRRKGKDGRWLCSLCLLNQAVAVPVIECE